ncbi:MAG TPA: hypothetical protein VFQ35_19695 [Polyangiaceae bacterium]|nr:hypothetical protein [Polyangiaceae bacterium]
MKPSDHPEFFRLPPPEGRSRESTIVLDSEGRFFHDGAPVTHPGMARAFSSWIARHPDDGRFILNNGYDWSYFRVEDAPFQVISLILPDDSRASGCLQVELSDGTLEDLGPESLEIGPNGAVYAAVKGGAFQARFSRAAQLALAPLLAEDGDGALALDFAGQRVRLPISSRKA